MDLNDQPRPPYNDGDPWRQQQQEQHQPPMLEPQHPQPDLATTTIDRHASGLSLEELPYPAPAVAAAAAPQQQHQQQIQQPKRDWWDMTRTLWHYDRMEQIGEGTYGQVYKAKCKDTGQIVALKKIRVHHGGYWGMPPTVIREIKILKRLRHPNLVQMVEVVSSKGVEYLDQDEEEPNRSPSDDAAAGFDEKRDSRRQQNNGNGDNRVSSKSKSSKKERDVDPREGYKGNLFLVLEYVSHDLTGLMDVAYKFTEVQVKSIFKQLLEALQYMHDNKYVHRDIKSSNILIDHNFRVKLADFGLARCIEQPILDKIQHHHHKDRGNPQEFTNKVITLWYRPPELLLGATRYGTAVDIWSAGCILAELILGRPLFTGKSDMDQLQLIFDMMGTPTEETWPRFWDLKLLRTGDVKIERPKQPKLRDRYQHKIAPLALNLIEKLLELDPEKRLTADRALESRYFLSEPRAPDQAEDMGPLLVEGGHFHEFQTKKKRREAKAAAEKVRQAALDGGFPQKYAQEKFDETYRGIMERVAQEGLDAKPEIAGGERDDEYDIGKTSKSSRAEQSERERKRSSRDKERDSRKESRSSKERREGKHKGEDGERDKESRRDRDKERSRRKRSESEERRKRKRKDSEEGRRGKERKKEKDERHDSTEIPKESLVESGGNVKHNGPAATATGDLPDAKISDDTPGETNPSEGERRMKYDKRSEPDSHRKNDAEFSLPLGSVREDEVAEIKEYRKRGRDRDHRDRSRSWDRERDRQSSSRRRRRDRSTSLSRDRDREVYDGTDRRHHYDRQWDRDWDRMQRDVARPDIKYPLPSQFRKGDFGPDGPPPLRGPPSGPRPMGPWPPQEHYDDRRRDRRNRDRDRR